MATATKNRVYIAALDVGTTTIRCHIFDKNAKTVSTAVQKVILVSFSIHTISNDDCFSD